MRFLLSCAGLAFLVGCVGNVGEHFPDNADHLTVYSLNGPAVDKQEGELTPEQAKGELFHGYPVLGKTEVTDADQRRALVSLVKEAIRDTKRPQAKCFIPRHGVRVVKSGTTYDLVLCFQCRNYQGYRSGFKARELWPVSPDAQLDFDELLRAANVPLAPK